MIRVATLLHIKVFGAKLKRLKVLCVLPFKNNNCDILHLLLQLISAFFKMLFDYVVLTYSLGLKTKLAFLYIYIFCCWKSYIFGIFLLII